MTGGVMDAALRSAYYLVTGKNPDPDAFSSVRGMQGWKEASFDIPGAGTVRTAVVSGLGNAEKLIQRIKGGEHFDFVEVMACPGGCINGAGQPFVHKAEKQARSNGLYDADRMCSIKSSEENPLIESLYNGILKGREHELLHVEYNK